jgi:diguanylate cyclase (GGDEF)-like protein
VTVRRPQEVAKVVLLIDPDKRSRQKGATLLRALGFEARGAADAFEAHALVDGTVAVIAAHPAAADIYPRLKATGVPFIAAFPGRQPRPAAVAAELGADSYLCRPYKKDTLGIALFGARNANWWRDRAIETELRLADTGGTKRLIDSSGVLHVDLFKTLLPLETRRARRHGYPIAICVVSVDPQAQASAGVLAGACEPLIRAALRDVDLAVRYGDGRFLVFLPHTDSRGAEVVGSRIVRQVRNCRLATGDGEITITASVGIATPRAGKAPSFSRLIRDAHAAVKAAQLKGGDRAVVR